MKNIVFNTDKTIAQYASQPLFFGDEPGLFDSIHKPYPKIWELYKTSQSLTWDANEFDYSTCNMEFKTCSTSIVEIFLKTISWQWSADSVASRSIISTLAPFVTDTSLWAALSSVNTIEQIHSETYSEIVRMSFDDPTQVLGDILAVKESIVRMDTVGEIFSTLHTKSHQYALGQITKEDAYDDVMMTIVALLLLERVQFMASFAVTFTICSTGLFQAIGKAVQKIAQDELEVHAELDKEVLRIELATERGKQFYRNNKAKIKQLCDEVVQSELTWTDYLFSEGRDLVGTNAAVVKNFVLFNAREVYTFLGIESDHKFPKVNPMPHVEDWISINKTQSAPQEQQGNQYKVGMIVRDDAQTTFDVDF